MDPHQRHPGRPRPLILAALIALACGPADEAVPEAQPDPPAPPGDDAGLRLPFPRDGLVVDGAITIPPDLPHAETPWSPPVPARTGFSTVQTTVIPLDVAVDPRSLPTWDAFATDGSVRLIDLTDGVAWPVMAEVDAAPDTPTPALLVRPLRPLPDGHEVAVVLTRAVRTQAGEPLVVPWFDAAIGGRPSTSTAPLAATWAALVDRLGALGVDDVALAISFPVQTGRAPLEAVLAATPEPPGTYALVEADDADLGDEVPPFTWRQANGTFTTTSWLGPDGLIAWGPDGPVPQGTVQAQVTVHVPDALRTADLGTAPVWVFGHGIFASPVIYLGDAVDSNGVLDAANRAGAVVVATTWRGLTTIDIGVPSRVAEDLATMPRLRDHLIQGVANTRALVQLVRAGKLVDAPMVAGRADPSTVRYYGISLGGIEGGVLLAAMGEQAPPGVLHVGGGAWSTMLERSTHWALFEPALIGSGLVEPTDRQLGFAATQLWWDPVDPAAWVDRLADRTVLWQLSAGDEQVANVASWIVARGAEAAMVAPSPAVVPGLDASATPTLPAVSLFDPGRGNDDGTNRPSTVTNAHDAPRTWEGAKQQLVRFLDPDDPGVIVAPCGPAPCADGRTGP